MSNKILTLPKISAEFTAHCKGRELAKNEWMPCPRCGGKSVDPPSGAGLGVAAGILTMVVMAVILGGIAFIAFIVVGPLAQGFLVAGAILILISPFLGAAMGAIYKCKACSFVWSYSNIEELMKLVKE